MSAPYHHIFFDLDHTLWDFEKNSFDTLQELYTKYLLEYSADFKFEEFFQIYLEINYRYWEDFRIGKISKEFLRKERFKETFAFFNIDTNALIETFAIEYITICPQKTNLIPFAHEVLAYLQQKYTLHIISNGFMEIQKIKLESSGMHKYFENVITSDTIGFKKPDNQVFDFALKQARSIPEKCVMIGDELFIDIVGARNVQMDQIYYNPSTLFHNEKVTFEIKCLSEIKAIL